MTCETITDPLAASLAEIDRAFARMNAERAKLSPEFRAMVKASLADTPSYPSTASRVSDAEFDYHTAQAGSGYYR